MSGGAAGVSGEDCVPEGDCQAAQSSAQVAGNEAGESENGEGFPVAETDEIWGDSERGSGRTPVAAKVLPVEWFVYFTGSSDS